MKDTDYAWAAGFWDGEGCVSLTYRQWSENTPRIPRIVVQVAQVDRRVLDRFQSVVGYGNVLGPYKPRSNNAQPYHVWRVEGVPHLQRMRDLLAPYLGEVKLNQMDIALEARRVWEKTATCLVHGTRLVENVSGGRWNCPACLSDAGKKAAKARWGSKDVMS